MREKRKKKSKPADDFWTDQVFGILTIGLGTQRLK
jgi:hypothetical protein